jgi:hypothetical protein
MVGAYVKSENLRNVQQFNETFTKKLDQSKCVNDYYSMQEVKKENNQIVTEPRIIKDNN